MTRATSKTITAARWWLMTIVSQESVISILRLIMVKRMTSTWADYARQCRHDDTYYKGYLAFLHLRTFAPGNKSSSCETFAPWREVKVSWNLWSLKLCSLNVRSREQKFLELSLLVTFTSQNFLSLELSQKVTWSCTRKQLSSFL